MELLQQIFTNILLIAIQSVTKGHGAADIGIGKADAGKVIMVIRDNSCGIPPEHLQMLHRLFQTTKERSVGGGRWRPYPDGQPIKPRQHGGSRVPTNLSVWEMGVDQ